MFLIWLNFNLLFCFPVFISLQRRHFEQMKVAIPIILNVLKAACSELGDEDTEDLNLFHRAIGIADSIRAVCAKFVCHFSAIFYRSILLSLEIFLICPFDGDRKAE